MISQIPKYAEFVRAWQLGYTMEFSRAKDARYTRLLSEHSCGGKLSICCKGVSVGSLSS